MKVLPAALTILGLLACRRNAAPEKQLTWESAQPGQEGCLDRKRPVTADELLPLGFTAGRMMGVVGNQREALLGWSTGGTTTLSYTLETPSPFYVESQHDPNFRYDIGVRCANHLLLEGAVRLATADGRLDERWPRVQIRSFGAPMAELILVIDAKAIRGRYQQNFASTRCLHGVQFDVAFSLAGFSGEILDSVETAPCGSVDPMVGITAARAGSWDEARMR